MTLKVNQVVHGLIGIAMGRIAVPLRGQLCSQRFASLPSFARGVLKLTGKHKRTQSVLNVPPFTCVLSISSVIPP